VIHCRDCKFWGSAGKNEEHRACAAVQEHVNGFALVVADRGYEEGDAWLETTAEFGCSLAEWKDDETRQCRNSEERDE
jgi:hypothetical protein